MILTLTSAEYSELKDYISRAYSSNYRNDLYDTEPFDSLADKVYELEEQS